MRIRLTIFLLLATAFSAAAQFPVKTVNQYPSVYPPAEFHFVDGNVGNYPVKRISKDLVRVDSYSDQSIRMPLTYVESIRFDDGCTLFFENGQFQFDRLVGPARIKNESGDVLLEGVLQLSKRQAEALMGPVAYGEFRKNARTLHIGIGTMAAGTFLSIPYLSSAVLNSFESKNPIETFKELNSHWKAISISGGCLLIGGIIVSIIGNSGCNRVAASYNDGLGLSVSF